MNTKKKANRQKLQPNSKLHSSSQNGKDKQPARKEHTIAQALDVFLHRCTDIKFAAAIFVPIAGKFQVERHNQMVDEYKKGAAVLKRNDHSYAAGMKQTQNAILQLKHLSKSKLPSIVESSLFLKLFSAFDAFTGDLLTAIYKKKPKLFESISRSLKVSEILEFKTLEEIQEVILREEIENFRRNSYVDQFKELESTFGLKLRAFEDWPNFVECSQRRNLFTHCDGKVSQQYIDVCEREAYKFQKRPTIGEELKLGPEYFLPVCDLVAEVALKLCHTVWRKLFPEELEQADDFLIDAIYERLETEDYKRAFAYSTFALGQAKISSDLHRRMFLINNAISLKFSGKSTEAQSTLTTEDWTSCSPDLRIAVDVLLDKFDDATHVMKKMGRSGQIITEESYHTWPLFKEFRSSPKFLTTYREIYGRPFLVKMQKNIEKDQKIISKKNIEKSK